MPTVSMANFEGEDLLSNRLLSFMANGEQANLNSESLYHLGGNVNEYLSASGISDSGSVNISNNSPVHRNIATNPHDKASGGGPIGSSNEIGTYNAVSLGPITGSCTPPPTAMSAADLSNNFIALRHNQVGAPYSALTSPSPSNKLASIPQHSLLNLSGAANGSDRHSLQNSPFYNHYPVSGNLQAHMQRQFSGLSPGHTGNLFPNGINNYNNRSGLYQDAAYSLPGFRSNSNPGCPQRELFPTNPPQHANNNNSCHNFMGPGLLMQDRLHYYAIAQKHGFIVGNELERIKENSRRSTSQSYGRISAYFRNRYGETEAKTKAAYLQLGVRVPSKDHVSEIVGKGGQKIKLIREETGALITTPGEQEEHVFIIEAPPEIAMRVAHHLATRAQEITQSKLVAGERRRGSTSSQSCVTENCSLPINGSNITSNVPNLTPNGPVSNNTNNFLVPNTCPSSGLLSIGNSASSSPLHPLAVSSAFVGNILPSNNTTVRSPNANLFSNSAFSSLPASPGNSSNQVHCNSSLPTNGLFSSTSTPGSRVLLARGRISVPQEMVGKIIGTQGSIITTIQKDTGTEIKSPPKEAARGPNATSEFEISAYQGLGLSSNQAAECRVQQAKQLIGHLVMRQLERRASEEVEENSGSSNLSAEDQRLTTANNISSSTSATSTTTTRTTSNSWMWPDVAQMDSQEAREVLDRILAESKNKTRRVKELAAAATSGPSPTSSCSASVLNTPGSLLNLNNCNGSQNLLPDQQQTNFQSHLLSGNYFDSNNATTSTATTSTSGDCCNGVGCEDLNSIHPNVPLATTFNSTQQGNGGTLFSACHLTCSPRGMKSFDLSANGDSASQLNRAPASTFISDFLWSSAPNFHNLLNGSNSPLMRTQTGDLLNGINNVISSSRGLDDSFEASIFNFNDLRHEIEAECPVNMSVLQQQSDHHHHRHTQHQQQSYQDSPQPLTRRHSDWVVSSTNLLSDMTSVKLPPSATAVAPMTVTGNNITSSLPESSSSAAATDESTITPNGLIDPTGFSTNNFNLFHTLDQLYLNSNTNHAGTANTKHIIATTMDTATVSVTDTVDAINTNGLGLCPPGFESRNMLPNQFDSVFSLNNPKDTNFNHHRELWSSAHLKSRMAAVNPSPSTTSSSLMTSPAVEQITDTSSLQPTADNATLMMIQHLFGNSSTRLHNGDDDDDDNGAGDGNDHQNISRCMNNSIWSQTDLVTTQLGASAQRMNLQQQENIPISAIDPNPLNYSYLRTSLRGGNNSDSRSTSTNNVPNPNAVFEDGLHEAHNPTNTSASLTGHHSARCGAIGEGRRRRRPRSPSLLTDADEMSLSVSSAIASTTEVA